MRFQVLFVLSTPMGPAVVCRDVVSRSPGGFGWSNWTICHVTSKNRLPCGAKRPERP